MTTPPLIVPSIFLDTSLLDRLAASVDFPIESKVILNGGRMDSVQEWQYRHPEWTVYSYSKNLGFAGSCNMGTKLFPNADGWLLMNDDGEFQPGCLERMCKAYHEHAKDRHIIYVNNNQAFDICIWTKKGLEEFGTFDENYFPAYFEDVDMRCRFNLDPNFKSYVIPPPFPVKHGKPRSCGPKYMAMMDALKPLNEGYQMRKWGTLGDKPIYKNPFFNPNNKISDWSLEIESRKAREVICAEFWNQSKPSLYE